MSYECSYHFSTVINVGSRVYIVSLHSYCVIDYTIVTDSMHLPLYASGKQTMCVCVCVCV